MKADLYLETIGGCITATRGGTTVKHFRKVILAAMMTGLSVVLTRFASLRISLAGVEGIRIGLGSLPNIVAGITLGPLYGGLAGAVSDIAGFLMSSMGGYMPHFTLTAALAGAIPGLVFRLTGGSDRPPTWTRLAVSVAAGNVLVSLSLTPYFLCSLFGMDYRVIMIPRIVGFFVEVPVYTVVVRALLVNATAMGLLPRQSGLH